MKDVNNGEPRPLLKLADAANPGPANVGSLQRLFLWKRDVCQMIGVSVRTLERMISAGEIPKPDRRLRGRPAWRSKTIYDWADGGSLSVTMRT